MRNAHVVAMYLPDTWAAGLPRPVACFYDARDHSIVSYEIQRIEALRESDSEVDALITGLEAAAYH